jgi:hypothetical protein
MAKSSTARYSSRRLPGLGHHSRRWQVYMGGRRQREPHRAGKSGDAPHTNAATASRTMMIAPTANLTSVPQNRPTAVPCPALRL